MVDIVFSCNSYNNNNTDTNQSTNQFASLAGQPVFGSAQNNSLVTHRYVCMQ